MSTAGRSRFVSNTAALGASTVVSTVFTLLQVKILAAYLPLDMFGLFAALRGLSLLISMVAANGLPQLLVRYLPLHEARGDARRAAVLSLACVSIAAVATVLLAMCVHVFRDAVMSSVPAAVRDGTFLLWFYATTLGVSLKLVLYGGFNGLRRLKSQTWLESVSLAVQVGWVFALRDRLDLETLFMILGVVSLAGVLVGVPWYARHLQRDIPERGETGAPVSYRSYWPGAAGLSLVAVAFTDVDRYVLSGVLALEMLSLFHVASRAVRLANRFLGIPVLAFQPEVSRVDAEGRGGEVEFSTGVFLKFNVVVSLFVASAVAVFAGEIIRLFSNAAYLPARSLLLVMSIAIPLTAMTAPLTAVMKSRNEVRLALVCDLVWALCYLVALVLLGRRFGLLGAGYAHVAACVVQLAVAVRLSHVPSSGRIAHALTRGGLACLLAFAAPLAAQWLPWPEWWRIVARVALLGGAVAVFRAAVIGFGVFDAVERARLGEMLARGGAPGRFVGRLLV